MPIVRIPLGPVSPLSDAIAPEKRVSGAPMTGVRAAYENSEAGFYTGVWESEPGAWTVEYTEDELCVILEGRGRLVSIEGHEEHFGPGDCFVIPRGYKGVWETIDRVRKIYAILT